MIAKRVRPAKLERCACGRKGAFSRSGFAKTEHRIFCPRPCCWIGPWRATRHDAIAAWNRTMRVHEIQRAARAHLRKVKAVGRHYDMVVSDDMVNKIPMGKSLRHYEIKGPGKGVEAVDVPIGSFVGRLKRPCRVAIGKVKK
jgi:hypothetical protein